MTREVIDAMTSRGWTGRVDRSAVDRTAVDPPFRYDTSLRVVIWTDALLSAGLALVAVLSPLLIVLPVSTAAATAIGLVVLAAALVLAALGAVTALLLVARMRAGHGHVPPGLRLPLPAAMRPDLASMADRGARRAPGGDRTSDLRSPRRRHAAVPSEDRDGAHGGVAAPLQGAGG
jgi:hypothetical protein